jgi:tetratricopeptide (TPR) repeat protein
MQYHLKSLDAAFDSYQEALRLRRDFYGGDDHPDVASNLNSIGLVLFKQDMFELSKQCFTESLRIREKILGPNHRDVAILWYNIATIYFETGQDDVAIQLYKETLRVERVALGVNHPDVVLTLQHIGQVLQQLGDLEGALQHFREALEIERRREADELSVAKILNLIGNIYLQQGKVDHMMKCFIDSSRIFEARQQPGETLVIAGYNFYGLSKIHPVSAAVA